MYSTKTPAKILRVAILLVFLLAGIASCSGSNGELTVLMEPDGTGAWREIIDRFNTQHPGAPVRLVEGPPTTNTREDMYATAFLGGQGYDIVYADVIWIPKFAAAGWLLDLTDLVADADRQDFLQADLDGGTYDGRLYRIPAFTDGGVLYYRSDLVDTPPQTFQELMQLASDLRTDDRWGYVWQGRQYEGLITNFLEVLWGHGGDWISLDRRVHLDSPEALEALLFMKSTLGAISPQAVTSYIEEDTRSLFQEGRSVFLRNWLYVSRLVEGDDSAVKGRVGYVPMVHAPGHASAAALGGWGFGVSASSPNRERAWEFVRFATAPEQLQVVQERMGRVPARHSMVPPQFVDILDSARPRPPIPEYAVASDILQRWLSAALTGSAEPQEALLAAARETRALLGTD